VDTNESERGVKNPKVVDLITLEKKSDRVILTMVEDRPWGESEEQLQQLEEKFNNYFDYIMEGWMYQQYPEYAGKRCCIRVEGQHPPDAKQQRFFDVMKRFCAENEIDFEVA